MSGLEDFELSPIGLSLCVGAFCDFRFSLLIACTRFLFFSLNMLSLLQGEALGDVVSIEKAVERRFWYVVSVLNR